MERMHELNKKNIYIYVENASEPTFYGTKFYAVHMYRSLDELVVEICWGRVLLKHFVSS